MKRFLIIAYIIIAITGCSSSEKIDLLEVKNTYEQALHFYKVNFVIQTLFCSNEESLDYKGYHLVNDSQINSYNVLINKLETMFSEKMTKQIIAESIDINTKTPNKIYFYDGKHLFTTCGAKGSAPYIIPHWEKAQMEYVNSEGKEYLFKLVLPVDDDLTKESLSVVKYINFYRINKDQWRVDSELKGMYNY